MSARAPLSVSQVNELVRMTFDSNRLFSSLSVVGEISNLKIHFSSGHIYFSLKDEDSMLKCVMFRMDASKLQFVPENGLKVVVKGKITVFCRDGQYQLYASEMEPDGLGGRYLAYEQLKNKLEKMGLFNEKRKRPLPAMPKRIGVITSASGAAFQDILNILRRRYPLGEVLLYPAYVQGAEAAPSLVAGVEWFTKYKDMADVLIIGRGGGSFEDLFAFNDEKLALALAACPIPTVSAVGHETDYTICDFVCDMRAPTPSAAAELVAPDLSVISEAVNAFPWRMQTALAAKIEKLSDRVRFLSDSKMLASPMEVILEKERIFKQNEERFFHAGQQYIRDKYSSFSSTADKLQTLSPLSILSRGYAAVFDEEKRVVYNTDRLEKDQNLTLRFADGGAHVKVLDVFRKENEDE